MQTGLIKKVRFKGHYWTIEMNFCYVLLFAVSETKRPGRTVHEMFYLEKEIEVIANAGTSF